MAIKRNNHVFKGHKTLLGSKFVTYGELELPLRYDLFPKSKNGFDWGYSGSATIQLAFSMLYQLSDNDFAKENASKFSSDVIKNLNSRDWVMSASDVLDWIKDNSEHISDDRQDTEEVKLSITTKKVKKTKKQKTNVVKEVCNELNITQKNLAHILEVPEGTVSSWAVKNEIPRLGKKAIEFYIKNQQNQQIVDSYKSFVKLLNAS